MRRFRVRRTAFHAQDTCEAFHVRSVAGVLLIDRPDVTLDPNPLEGSGVSNPVLRDRGL